MKRIFQGQRIFARGSFAKCVHNNTTRTGETLSNIRIHTHADIYTHNICTFIHMCDFPLPGCFSRASVRSRTNPLSGSSILCGICAAHNGHRNEARRRPLRLNHKVNVLRNVQINERVARARATKKKESAVLLYIHNACKSYEYTRNYIMHSV